MDDQDSLPYPSDPPVSRAEIAPARENSARRGSQPFQPYGGDRMGERPSFSHFERQHSNLSPGPKEFSAPEREEREFKMQGSVRSPRSRRRGRLSRIIVPLFMLLLGIAIGLSALLWYGFSGEGPLVIIPPSARGNVIIEADKDFVTQLVQKDLADAGLPGQVTNVQVELERGAEIIITGSDTYSLLGAQLTRHFTVNVQPYVQSCTLQMRVTHADLGGIPVTTTVQSFEGDINRQLGQKPDTLPGGFTYCTVGVRTEPGGLFITYQATPVPTSN